MEEQQDIYDVIIVGYGLVGNLAALLAGHYRLKVAVVEQKALRDLPIAKAGRLDGEVMRIFEQLGIRKEIEPLLDPLKGTQIIDNEGQVLFELRHKQLEDCAPMYSFYQPELQRKLQAITARKVRRLRILEQVKAEALESITGGVTVHLSYEQEDKFISLQSRFVLVCNGQSSLLTAQLDMPFRSYGYASYTLNVDTYTSEPMQRPQFAQTVCNAEVPVTCIAAGQRHQRWEFQLSEENVKEVNTPHRIRQLLEQLIEQPFEVESAFLLPFETKLLNKWQHKRIFVTGDAAHIMPPYLGLGLSAGLKDVYNLIWKISLVADHQVDGHLLDYYQGERESNVKHLINLNLSVKNLFRSQWLKIIKTLKPIIPKAWVQRRLQIETRVKYGLVGIVSKWRGRMLPHPELTISNGKKQIIDQLLGNGFAFIVLDENPVDAISAHQVAYLAALRTHFIQLIPPSKKFVTDSRYATKVYDQDGKLSQWMQQHRLKYMLVRPDRILFDGAKNQRQLKRMLGLLERKLSAMK